jgi:phosphoribosylformylglycinamidine cyclo-ligase
MRGLSGASGDNFVMDHKSAGTGTLSYEQAGVNYDLIDPLKVAAQRAAAATATHLAAHGFTEVKASRGESAYVVDVGPFYLASIVECLGSKTLVADEMAKLTGRSYFASIAQDTIAMAVNDLITVGATPLVVQAYWAAGGSDWFGDAQRAQALVEGWKRACDVCGVAWGGGETPALAGIVEAGRIDLAASCTGLINPKERLSVGDKLAAGDAIVLLASSGIHANGLSLARKLVERLPEGYLTKLEDGTTYGEALLAPTVLYSPVTEALYKAGITPHYCANITGHGWRKLLRHPAKLTYRIDAVPPVPPVLKFIQQHAKHDDREAYSTLNMGAGFALFVDARDAQRTVDVARSCGIDAIVAGRVEDGPKQLLIEPLSIRFGDDDLQLR